MSERRMGIRLSFRQRILFGVDSPKFPAFTEDISLLGLQISSHTALPKGTKIKIRFDSDKNFGQINIQGVVCYLHSLKTKNKDKEMHHMGIHLTWRDENYLQLLSHIIEERRVNDSAFEQREFTRYKETVEIIFESAREIFSQLTDNISKGGIFVVTDQPLPSRTKVSLRLVIPQIMEDVHAVGQVMYRIDLSEAKKIQKPPGMGIKFIKFAPGDRSKFVSFLGKLAAASKKLGL